MSDLKNRVRIGISIDKELAYDLAQLSEQTMIPKSKLMDRGIELILQEKKYKRPKKDKKK